MKSFRDSSLVKRKEYVPLNSALSKRVGAAVVVSSDLVSAGVGLDGAC